MIVIQIFLLLLWASAIVGALSGGVWSIVEVTRWPGTQYATKASGVIIRAVLVCLSVACLIGGPLLALGWA